MLKNNREVAEKQEEKVAAWAIAYEEELRKESERGFILIHFCLGDSIFTYFSFHFSSDRQKRN